VTTPDHHSQEQQQSPSTLTHPTPQPFFSPIKKKKKEKQTYKKITPSAHESHNANQTKELIDLQCQQPASHISVNQTKSPVQLCTQNIQAGLKGKGQSTEQQVGSANRVPP